MRSQPIPGGRLWLNPALPDTGPILDFARSGGAGGLPESARVATSSPRNRVFDIEIPGIGRCILKEFTVQTNRGIFRRLETAFKLRFVHRGLRTMRLALDARQAGFPTYEPCAFWTDYRGRLRNYFLYRRLDGIPLNSLLPLDGADPARRAVVESAIRQLGRHVRTLHDAGIIHTDLHPGNILLPEGAGPDAPIAVIDMDSAYRPFAPGRRALYTARAKSLRRLHEFLPDLFPLFADAYAAGDAALSARLQETLAFWRPRYGRDRRVASVAAWLASPPPRGWKPAPPLYDLVFSLGYDCNCSLALRRAGLQFYSYPFDWTTRAPLATRAQALAEGFSRWLRPGDLQDLGAATFDRFSRQHHVVVDSATGLEFRHDFPLELSLADGLPDVARKYARRSDRLLRSIRESHRVLAIFATGFRHEELPLAELEAAYDRLAAAFGPGRIELLGVCDDQPDIAHPLAWTHARGGHVHRVSLAFGFHSAQGFEVRDRVLARFLRDAFSARDPRTPEECRAHKALEKDRTYQKYRARSRLSLFVNKLQFRLYRTLAKKLQKKGILPPNEPLAK